MLSQACHIIVTLVILFISSVLVDDGRSIMILSDNIEFQIDHDHHDLEIPHQNNNNDSVHDEEFLGINGSIFSCPSQILFLSASTCETGPRDYPGSIWEPPK